MDIPKGNNKKGQLYAELHPQARTEEERRKVYAFIDKITEKQANQILVDYDYQIPFDIVERGTK